MPSIEAVEHGNLLDWTVPKTHFIGFCLRVALEKNYVLFHAHEPFFPGRECFVVSCFTGRLSAPEHKWKSYAIDFLTVKLAKQGECVRQTDKLDPGPPWADTR
mmetsp:Transcript_16459/g.27195  ORF Transcript_16459/g.27195 Transcript_16459/m.27195 type:complete len:103 (-) Transcript_16459:101-409(-)